MEDGHQPAAARLNWETVYMSADELGWMTRMVHHNAYLTPVMEARLKFIADMRIVTAHDVDEDVCRPRRECLISSMTGEFDWSRNRLGGQPNVLKAGLASFANAEPWGQRVDLSQNLLTSDDARVVAKALWGNKHFQLLILTETSIEDAGAETLAAALPSRELKELRIYGNLLSEGAHLNLQKVCRERGIEMFSEFLRFQGADIQLRRH